MSKTMNATEAAVRHLVRFKRDWMFDLVAENPETPEMDLYHDGLQAYMASEVDSKAVRDELARISGVMNNVDNY